MSGMSVTPARQVRVAFSDPYMRSGLAAATRRGDLPEVQVARRHRARLGERRRAQRLDGRELGA